MTVEEKDLLDSAIDAAEAQMEEAASAEPEQEEVTSAAGTPAEESSEDEAPKGRARDEKGKFTKAAKAAAEEPEEAQVSDQNANAETVEATEASAESTPEQPIELPAFWPAELKQAAAEAPKALLEAFIKHDAQREEWARRSVSETEPAKAYQKRVKETFEPYRLKLQASGVKDELEAASRLLAWNEIFEKDVDSGLIDLMRKNGRTPEDLAALYYGTEQAQQYPQDPRVEEALAEAKEAKRMAEEYQAQIEAQKQQELKYSIETFKQGKDSHGNVRKQFAELYAPQITQAADAIQAEFPQMPLNEVLGHAYEYVLDGARKAFGVNGNGTKNGAPVQKSAEQQVADAKKAKAAATSASGAPSVGTISAKARPKAKDFNEAFDLAYSNAEEAISER